nr:transcriptional repressor [Streptomyces sp. FT05W]
MSLIGIIPKRWLTAYVIETEAKALLRGASLRVTRPRVAVLSAVHEAPHSDASTLLTLVRTRIGAVSTQAVYDVLRTLVDAGLARRIDLPSSAARFEGRSWDNHQHVVCRSCGTIADVDVPQGAPRPGTRGARGSRVHRGPRRGDVLGPVSRMPGRARSAGSGVGAPKSSRRGAGKFLTTRSR